MRVHPFVGGIVAAAVAAVALGAFLLLRGTPPRDTRLPDGYTLRGYEVAEVTETSCVRDEECMLPGSYAIRSSCPYQSLCLEHRCTIVCPQHD